METPNDGKLKYNMKQLYVFKNVFNFRNSGCNGTSYNAVYYIIEENFKRMKEI